MFNLTPAQAIFAIGGNVLTLGALALANAQPAQAQSMCTYESGLSFCLESLAMHSGGHDVFNVKGNGLGRPVSERFEVQCSGGRTSSWNSYGNLSELEAEAIVHNFCSGRGTTGL